MRVEDAEGRRLAAEMDEDAHEKRVLDHVGEVAGVEGVAVVHADALPKVRRRCRTASIDGDLVARRGSRAGRRPGRSGNAQVLRQADADLLQQALRQATAIMSVRRPGLAATKARSRSSGVQLWSSAGLGEGGRDDDLVAGAPTSAK